MTLEVFRIFQLYALETEILGDLLLRGTYKDNSTLNLMIVAEIVLITAENFQFVRICLQYYQDLLTSMEAEDGFLQFCVYSSGVSPITSCSSASLRASSFFAVCSVNRRLRAIRLLALMNVLNSSFPWLPSAGRK